MAKKSLQLKAEGCDLIKVHLLSIYPLWLSLHQEELQKAMSGDKPLRVYAFVDRKTRLFVTGRVAIALILVLFGYSKTLSKLSVRLTES
ncbi:hypothetical protein GS682_11880 [Nostoc sp. B(2019)]|nr:hypothetical protein [Nostoc sp. B(2019)]